MIYIDKYAYVSKLRDKDPMLKLYLSFISLFICIWVDSIAVSLILILGMGWLTVSKGNIPFSFYFKLLLLPMSFLIIGILTIVIGFSIYDKGFLFDFRIFGGYIGVTQRGVGLAYNMFFKAMGAVSCLYFLSLSTPMVSLLSTLKRLKVPKLFIELMGLIYRFIFVLLETADTIYISQSSRLGYISLRSGYRSLGGLASALFTLSYKRSQDLYTALEARGYDCELNVLEENTKSKPIQYALVTSFEILLVATALLGRSLGI